MEEYAITLGELRDVIEDAIKWYGTDTPYTLVGCYSFEGLVEKSIYAKTKANDAFGFSPICVLDRKGN